jgi:hypothetical protein
MGQQPFFFQESQIVANRGWTHAQIIILGNGAAAHRLRSLHILLNDNIQNAATPLG